jgi:hypothetical protein
LAKLERHLRHRDAYELVRPFGYECRGTEVARDGLENFNKGLASDGKNPPDRQLMACLSAVAIHEKEDEFGALSDVWEGGI